jgi:CHAT domain-containing protein/tetratricopeptide (TPR) repeat protein
MERTWPERPRYPSGMFRLVVLALLAIVACQTPERGRAQVEHVRQAFDTGDYVKAERLATECFTNVERDEGADALATGRALDLLVEASIKNGNAGKPDAPVRAERAVRLKEQHLGPNHVETADSLHNLGTVHLQRGEFPLAVAALERSLAIRTAVLGADATEVADTLDQLGLALVRLERFREADQTLAKSQHIRERASEQAPLALAETYELVALLYRWTDNYQAALPLIDRALEIQRRLAPHHPDEIFALQTRGDVLLLMGDAIGAEQDWKSALELATRTLRADHPLIAETFGRLSLAAFSLGNLAEARRLAERARDVGDRSLAPCDPAGPVLAVALADALRYDGQYAEARKLYRGTLEKVRGCINSGATAGWTDAEATLVFNDAGVARDVGDLVEADGLYTRAVDIWSKGLGPNHSFVARGLDAVADVAAARGDLARAHDLYERALTIRRRSLGPDHPHVAWTLTNLAKTEAGLGNVSLALRYVQEAIAIYRKSGTADEPDHFARVLELRGSLEERRGHPRAARESVEQAMVERTRIFGPNHPLVTETRASLAAIDLTLGDREKAMTGALDVERLAREHLLFTVRYLPERQALTYASTRPQGLNLALTILSASPADSSRVLDAVIRSRGVLLDEFAAARRRETSSTSPDMTKLVAETTAARQRYANLVVRSLQEPVRRDVLDESRRQKDDAERALGGRNHEARAELTRVAAGLNEVRRALPANAVLVSFVRYDRKRSPRSATLAPDVSYAAFIVKPDSDRVAFVPLGSASSLDGVIQAWRNEASGKSIARGVPAARAERNYRTEAMRLRRAVWDPLAPHVAGASRVFVVPDGLLNLVNLSSLPDGDGYLAERTPIIHYLTTERDLLVADRDAGAPGGLLTVGGPAFDDGPTTPVATEARRGADCQSLAQIHFANLPGSLSEVAEIGSLWPKTSTSDVTLLSGAAATETAVKKAVAGRRVVHLATHGFVLGTDCESNPVGVRAVGGLARTATTSAAVTEENPLLRTGLALAGANRRGAAPLDQDEGILTAEEIAGLNLQGTEWAVLSACDTGLGEIKAGEGVFGLRRAFQIAGARTVIMSLWPVEDVSTRDWMRVLYEGRLQKKLDTATAVREAGLTVLRTRRAQGHSTHPFYWAAFVAAGDWR